MGTRSRGMAVWGAALWLSGCGAAIERPACRAAYDACINGCAAQCDTREQIEAESPDVVNTWGSGCGRCESTCRDQGEACEDRARRAVAP